MQHLNLLVRSACRVSPFQHLPIQRRPFSYTFIHNGKDYTHLVKFEGDPTPATVDASQLTSASALLPATAGQRMSRAGLDVSR